MSQPKVSIIVAMDEKRGIGKDNDLLFRIPEDGKRVRQITDGHPLIMGRKTFESLGRLLPNRTHIVVTRNPETLKNLSYQPHATARNLQEAIEAALKAPGSEEIFIFGGGQIYAESLAQGIVDTLYLTIVKGDFKADTFFPDYNDFNKVVSTEDKEADGYKYTFIELKK